MMHTYFVQAVTIILILINYDGSGSAMRKGSYIRAPGDKAEWIAISVAENRSCDR